MANVEVRKSTVGLQRLTVWPLTADTEESITYGTAVAFTKALMTATKTPTNQTAKQDADDQIVDSISITSGGQIALGLTAINSADRKLLYGNDITNGTNVVNKDDISPYVMVAYMTTRSDGKVNLYKILKSAFAPQAETFNTKSSGGIQYAVTNIQGEYIPTINSGDMEYIRYGVDPVTDSAIITSWFTDASYNAPAQA